MEFEKNEYMEIEDVDIPSQQEIYQLLVLVQQSNYLELQKQLDRYQSILAFVHIIDYTKSDMLKLFIYSHLKKFIKQKIFSQYEVDTFLKWIIDQIIEGSENIIFQIQNGFCIAVSYFYKYQIAVQNSVQFVDRISRLIKSNKPNQNITVLKVCIQILEVIKQDCCSYDKLYANKIINKFMWITFKIYSQIVIPTEDQQNPFELNYIKEEYGVIQQLAYNCLKLLKECICYDFLGFKKQQDIDSEFVQTFSPIVIPLKGVHKNDAMINFDPIRANDILDEIYFIYNNLTWNPLRVLIIELFGDVMRISPRFFMVNNARDTNKYFEKMGNMMKILNGLSQNLQLSSNEDISIIVAFGQTLKKSTSIYQINKMPAEVLRELVINTTEFLYEQMIDKNLISVKILTPYFQYFQKLENYKFYTSITAKNNILIAIKTLKTRFLNKLMDIMDQRCTNGLQFDQKEVMTSIKDEMRDDPLTNQQTMEQYLVILRMMPIDLFEQETGNFDIQILFNYIKIQKLISEYSTNKNNDIQQKQKVRNQIISIIDWVLDKMVKFSDFQTINKLRLLLHHIMKGIVKLPQITTFNLKFNVIANQIKKTMPLDYKLLFGLLILSKNKKLQCESIKKQILQSMSFSRSFSAFEEFHQCLKLYSVVAQGEEIIAVLQKQNYSPYLKLISCYQSILSSKQFNKFHAITEWFFLKHYQPLISQLCQNPPISFTIQITKIVNYLFKINQINNVQTFNQRQILQLINPILQLSISNLMGALNPDLQNIAQSIIDMFTELASCILLSGDNDHNLLQLEQYREFLQFVQQLLPLINKTYENLPNQKQSQFMNLIELYMKMQKRNFVRSDHQNVQNIIIKCFPASLSLISQQLSNPNNTNFRRKQFLVRIIHETIKRQYSYLQWKSILKTYRANENTVQDLIQEDPNWTDYFYQVQGFENIHISQHTKIDDLKRKMFDSKNFKYETLSQIEQPGTKVQQQSCDIQFRVKNESQQVIEQQ